MTHVVQAALFVALLAGCSGNDLEVVPVRGQITYGGGAWPESGWIFFTPVEPAAGLPDRPGHAHFDTSGHFQVTSFQENDGLVPGQYRAAVECWHEVPTMEDPMAGVSYVPKPFQSPQTSGLEVTIEPGQERVDILWDIPKQ
ncbi:MAG: hypothetical protein ACODAD_15090 [Planctomycetota bacterium]